MLRNFAVSAGEGRYRVEVQATLTADGLIVQVLGGEKPHVGAVVFSLPRPSQSEPGTLRATSTVVPRYGHRDDELARPLAERLVTALGQPVVVVAGVHIAAATPEEVKLLVANAHQAAEKLIAVINSRI